MVMWVWYQRRNMENLQGLANVSRVRFLSSQEKGEYYAHFTLEKVTDMVSSTQLRSHS